MDFKTILGTIACIIVFAVYVQYHKLKKVYMGLTLFNSKSIVENFRSIPTMWTHSTAHKGSRIANFTHEPRDLPKTFSCGNTDYDLNLWLKDHWTTGLVVLKIESPTKANLLHESYYLGNTFRTKTISWSVNKSVVSALVGIAISEGKIKSVEDFVVTYVPELIGSGYEAATIRNVLEMSSGVAFDEDYSNMFSDINKLCIWLSIGKDTSSFIKGLKQRTTPGTEFSYISVDTQVLGMVLVSAIGTSLTAYLEEKIWSKCGFETDCDWLTDSSGMELAFGTLNTCTRDYARFGWLYLNKGLSPVDGSRIINAEWIEESVKCTKAHFKPAYSDKIGYGYQWWLPGSFSADSESDSKAEVVGDYVAIGVYEQFVYVDPINKIVIAKNSANPHYTSQVNPDGSHQGEIETIAAFRAISKHYSTQ